MDDLDLYSCYRELIISTVRRSVNDLRGKRTTRYDRFTAQMFLASPELAELLDALDINRYYGKWAVEEWGIDWSRQN